MTWATAMRTLVSTLSYTNWGDQVWVEAGTYTENPVLTMGVGLYGGFAGTETTLSARQPKTNVTSIVDTAGNDALLIFPGSGPGTVVDGFTLESSYCGIYAYMCSATISNNVFVCTPGHSGDTYGVLAGSEFDTSDDVLVVTHNFESGFGFGFLLNGSCTVTDNVTANSPTVGIECTGEGLIANNTVVGGCYGIIVGSCTGTYKLANNIVAYCSCPSNPSFWCYGVVLAVPGAYPLVCSHNDVYVPGGSN
jgi:hypothetical protein